MKKKACLTLSGIVAIIAFSVLGSLHAQKRIVPTVRSYVILSKSQGPGSTALDQTITAAGGIITGRIEAIGVVFASASNPDFLAAVLADPRVSQAAADVEIGWLPRLTTSAPSRQALAPTAVNDEPYSGFQWNLRQIHADETAANGDQGWGVTRARVAVLDTGIWTTHPDIAPNLNVALSRSFVPSEPGIEPVVSGFSHGTHVAGIVATPINDIGVQGVAPRAEVFAVKVLRSTDGVGAFTWILNGIYYAVNQRADVINMKEG